MDDMYIPELTIQLVEKDISDAVYELQVESRKLLNSVDSLITTTELLKSGWDTSEGVVSTEKIEKLTSSLETISKDIRVASDNISVAIMHEMV